jgi:hypothetical protein
MPSGRRLATIVALVSIAVLGSAETGAADTVWLCKPGLTSNPCTPRLSTTVFSPSLDRLRTERVRRVRRPRYDCFYVYPTVSDQPGLQAKRRIDPELRCAPVRTGTCATPGAPICASSTAAAGWS